MSSRAPLLSLTSPLPSQTSSDPNTLYCGTHSGLYLQYRITVGSVISVNLELALAPFIPTPRRLPAEAVAPRSAGFIMRTRTTPELFDWSLRARQTDLYLALNQVKGKIPITANSAGSSPHRAPSTPQLTFPILFSRAVPNA